MNKQLSKKISLYKTARIFAWVYFALTIICVLVLGLMFLITIVPILASLDSNGQVGEGGAAAAMAISLSAFIWMIPLLILYFVLSIVIIVKTKPSIDLLSRNEYNIQETLTIPVLCFIFGMIVPGILLLAAQLVFLEKPKDSTSAKSTAGPLNAENVFEQANIVRETVNSKGGTSVNSQQNTSKASPEKQAKTPKQNVDDLDEKPNVTAKKPKKDNE